MRVAVTGATGFVGGHAVAAIHGAGHRVTALVRDRARLEAVAVSLDTPVPEVVVGDMTDAAAVARLVADADAVIHSAAVVSLDTRHEAEMREVNRAGTATVLDAAAAASLDPIVHVSSTSALFRPRIGPLSPDLPPVTGGRGYGASKAECEVLARRHQERGEPVAVVYPSGIIGPAAGQALGETADGVSRFLPGGFMPTHRGALSLIDVRDLAATFVALLEPGRGPRRIMAGGHLVTMQALALALRDLTGRRFPVPPIPPRALVGTGRLLDRLGRVRPIDTALTAEGMTLLTRWAGTDDSTLADLGVLPRDLRSSLADSLVAWRDAGLVTDRQIGRLAALHPSRARARPGR